MITCSQFKKSGSQGDRVPAFDSTSHTPLEFFPGIPRRASGVVRGTNSVSQILS